MRDKGWCIVENGGIYTRRHTTGVSHSTPCTWVFTPCTWVLMDSPFCMGWKCQCFRCLYFLCPLWCSKCENLDLHGREEVGCLNWGLSQWWVCPYYSCGLWLTGVYHSILQKGYQSSTHRNPNPSEHGFVFVQRLLGAYSLAGWMEGKRGVVLLEVQGSAHTTCIFYT